MCPSVSIKRIWRYHVVGLLLISCIPYNGPRRPEVSYLSLTCVMQPASQRDATQHGLRSHACTVHTAARTKPTHRLRRLCLSRCPMFPDARRCRRQSVNERQPTSIGRRRAVSNGRKVVWSNSLRGMTMIQRREFSRENSIGFSIKSPGKDRLKVVWFLTNREAKVVDSQSVDFHVYSRANFKMQEYAKCRKYDMCALRY